MTRPIRPYLLGCPGKVYTLTDGWQPCAEHGTACPLDPRGFWREQPEPTTAPEPEPTTAPEPTPAPEPTTSPWVRRALSGDLPRGASYDAYRPARAYVVPVSDMLRRTMPRTEA